MERKNILQNRSLMMWMMKFEFEVRNYLWMTSVQIPSNWGVYMRLSPVFLFKISFQTSHVLLQIASNLNVVIVSCLLFISLQKVSFGVMNAYVCRFSSTNSRWLQWKIELATIVLDIFANILFQKRSKTSFLHLFPSDGFESIEWNCFLPIHTITPNILFNLFNFFWKKNV